MSSVLASTTHLGLSLLLLGGRLGNSVKTSLLLLLGLRAVLVQELEQLSSSVLVEGVRELGDGRGHLEALAENDLLALKAHILGPLDEAGEVLLRLDVLACGSDEYPPRTAQRKERRRTDTEVLRTRLEEGVLLSLRARLGAERRGGRLLAGSLGGPGLVIETRQSAWHVLAAGKAAAIDVHPEL